MAEISELACRLELGSGGSSSTRFYGTRAASASLSVVAGARAHPLPPLPLASAPTASGAGGFRDSGGRDGGSDLRDAAWMDGKGARRWKEAAGGRKCAQEASVIHGRDLPRVRGRVRGARGAKRNNETAETFCIIAFFHPRGFRLAVLGGPHLTCGSSVRGVYVFTLGENYFQFFLPL
jgi:hypothetical protein